MTNYPRPMSDRPVSKDTPDRTDACPDVRWLSDSDTSDVSDATQGATQNARTLPPELAREAALTRTAVGVIRGDVDPDAVTAAPGARKAAARGEQFA
jgi:hypothetical protein